MMCFAALEVDQYVNFGSLSQEGVAATRIRVFNLTEDLAELLMMQNLSLHLN